MMWTISMFSPSGMYGFASDPEGMEVFFHAQDFYRLTPGGPPPVLGETVGVCEIDTESGNRPRAGMVKRTSSQPLMQGHVRSFDSQRGWGFADHADGQAFLHASELMSGWLPVIGSPIEFYLGSKKGRARACWVRPSEVHGTVTFTGGLRG